LANINNGYLLDNEVVIAVKYTKRPAHTTTVTVQKNES